MNATKILTSVKLMPHVKILLVGITVAAILVTVEMATIVQISMNARNEHMNVTRMPTVRTRSDLIIAHATLATLETDLTVQVIFRLG